MDSERGGGRAALSPGARRVVEGLLAGKSLDELAPRGSVVRAEVEAHIVASLEWATRARSAESARGAESAKSANTALGAARPKSPKSAKKKASSGAVVPAAGRAVAYSDGASRGNPGPAAIGYRIVDAQGVELFREGRRIGRATNNVAEYRAAIAALEKARELGLAELELRMDSELVVRQMEGTYRVREPALIALKRDVDRLLGHFRSVRVLHVRREQNRDTDGLANEALDAGVD
ncbi:MAG: ribonuclease HI family protein [bacterium]